MKKNDWFLAAGVVIAVAVILLLQIFGAAQSGLIVTVSVDGSSYGTYSLSEDRRIEINDTNRILIENGSVVMEWADCPDQLCVNHRSISRDGESIICLPNRVVVSIEGTDERKDEDSLDGIAG